MSIFSPDPDAPVWEGDDDVLINITPPPPPKAGPPSAHNATIRVQNPIDRRTGKSIQTLQESNRARWTEKDIEQLAFLGRYVRSRETNVELPAFSRADFAPGLRQFAGYLLDSGATALPPQWAGVLDYATEMYAANVERGDIAAEHPHRVQQLAGPILGDDEEDDILAPQPAAFAERAREFFGARLSQAVQGVREIATGVTNLVRSFGNLRMWEDANAPPDWLEHTSAGGRWLVDPPPGKKLTQWYATLPSGCCALKALANAGVPFKYLSREDPARWVGAPVHQLESFLREHNLPYSLLDGVGRTMLKHSGDEKTKRVRLVVANGHVTAFRSSAQIQPLKLVCEPDAPNAWIMQYINKHFGLRGSSTLETNYFYDQCGIRAALVTSPQQPDLVLDLNKAYPSSLLDESCVFPVATGDEEIRTISPPALLPREQIERATFYLFEIDLAPEERMLLRSNGNRFWFLGAAALRAWPHLAAFNVHGSFACAKEVKGQNFSTEQKKEILPALASLCEFGNAETRESVQKTIRKMYFAQLVQYSGILEMDHSTTAFASVPISEAQAKDEKQTLEIAAGLLTDYTPVFCSRDGLDYACLRRTRVWKTSGRPAKLALYCYTTAKLISLARAVKKVDPLAVLTMARTDSVGFSTVALASDLAEFIGEELGKFKVVAQRMRCEETTKAPISRIGSREVRYCLSGCDLTAPALIRTTKKDVAERLAKGWNPRLMLCGPPGSGKTHWIRHALLPSLEEQNIPYVLCTPMLEHAARINASTLEGLLSTTTCFDASRQTLGGSVLIVDEVGLANPSQLLAFSMMHCRGLVLVGDSNQLSACGDLLVIARRLQLPYLALGFHERDRFGGCRRMHKVLSLLEEAIETQRTAGDLGKNGLGRWPHGLELQLEAAGLRFADKMPNLEGAKILGWRHIHTDQYGGATVHSSQGATIEGRLIITDYKTDPRLLYTAISRAQSLDAVTVLRKPPQSSN